MKVTFKHVFLMSILAMASLISCSTTSKQINAAKYKRVLILGNSITQHNPAPDLGWYGNWGMAASARDSDFVHLLIAKFHAINPDIVVDFKNIANYERTYWTYNLSQLDSLKRLKPSLIILRLGENVDAVMVKEHGFERYYAGLISYFTADNPKVKVINAASFWKKDAVTNVIEAVSKTRGCRFVNLGELSIPLDNMASKEYTNKGVGIHPSNKGMKAIAETIWMEVMKLK